MEAVMLTRSRQVVGLGFIAVLVVLAAFLLPGQKSALALLSASPSPPATRAPVSGNSSTAAQCTLAGDTYLCTISSRAGWQQIPLDLNAGDSVAVTYVAGSWTVDNRLWPPVRPEGYTLDMDSQIASANLCKVMPGAPFAALLGQFGDGNPFVVARGGAFTAGQAGRLWLLMNDAEICQSDNEGAVTMQIAVRPPPVCARVSVDPPSLQLAPHGSGKTDVRITGASNLYGLHLSVKYDPSIAQAASPLDIGSLFQNQDYFVVRNEADNTNGVIEFAITLRAPAQPINGGGTLATINWQVQGTGRSAIHFAQVELSTPDGQSLCSTTADGTLQVGPDATISGRVLLQGAQDQSGTNVFLTEDPHACDGKACVQQLARVPLVTTGQDGRFTLSPETGQRYSCLWAYHACYLTGVKSRPAGDLSTLTLPAGDVNEDNCIDIRDLTRMASTCMGTANCPCADFNQDGQVDIFDLVIVVQNLGQCGSVSNWKP
jgi:hypothetical protein